MSIIRLIVGSFVTLRHPQIKKMLESMENADRDFQRSINQGVLMKSTKEMEAQAKDADTMLKKYVTVKTTEKDGTTFDPTEAFKEELTPFLKPNELAEAIAQALVGRTTAWADFDLAKDKVVEHAKKRRNSDALFKSDNPSFYPLPWEGLGAISGALNWAWGPMVEAVKNGNDPQEVAATTKLRVNAVKSSLGHLEKVRVAKAVSGLRDLLKKTRELIAEKSNERDVLGFFQQVEVLDRDLKRGGQGRGPSIGSRLGYAERQFKELTNTDPSYGGRLTEPGQA